MLSACMGLHSWGVPPYMAVARSVCVFKAENFLLGESPLFCDGLVEPRKGVKSVQKLRFCVPTTVPTTQRTLNTHHMMNLNLVVRI